MESDRSQETTPGVARHALRFVAGHFATGIVVLIVGSGDNRHGITLNSFVSISLEPPLVLVSIDQKARTHALLTMDQPYTLSILGARQQDLAERFAGRLGKKTNQFDGVRCQTTAEGLSYLQGAIARLSCRVMAIYAGGDHSLFLSEVYETEILSEERPLLFYRSHYTSVARAPV